MANSHLGRVDLMEVHYLPANSAVAEHVLLVLSEQRTGSNPGAEWIAQVLEFSKQQWKVIQQFDADLHNATHRSFSHTFDESTKTFVLRFDGLQDAHRCGTATDSCSLSYKWDGSRFRFVRYL